MKSPSTPAIPLRPPAHALSTPLRPPAHALSTPAPSPPTSVPFTGTTHTLWWPAAAAICGCGNWGVSKGDVQKIWLSILGLTPLL